MPRAFLKTKNCGGHKVYKCTVCNKPVEAGTQYYTWKFNHDGRYFQHAEHGPPKPSQLTNSKLGAVLDAVEGCDLAACESADGIKSALADVASAATDVAAEYSEAADGIESSWPSGNPTSEACRTTAEELETWANNLETWEPENDEPEPEHDQDEEAMEMLMEEWLEACRGEAQDLLDEQPEYQG